MQPSGPHSLGSTPFGRVLTFTVKAMGRLACIEGRPMDLSGYRKQFRVPFLSIAKSTGVSAATITLIAKGRRRPSQELADKIELATGGHVRAADLRNGLPAAPRAAPPVPPGAGPSGEAASRNPESDSAGEFRIAPNCAPAGTVASTAADHAADHAVDPATIAAMRKPRARHRAGRKRGEVTVNAGAYRNPRANNSAPSAANGRQSRGPVRNGPSKGTVFSRPPSMKLNSRRFFSVSRKGEKNEKISQQKIEKMNRC
jgi:hypothetical protein